MLALRDLMRPVGEHNILQPACPILFAAAAFDAEHAASRPA